MSEDRTTKRKGGWNYRVMRHCSSAANDEQFYAIHEVYYDASGAVNGWTQEPCGSPFGETLEEMTKDLAWIMTGLVKPVLDADTGQEVGPAALLTDDLSKMMREDNWSKLADGTVRRPDLGTPAEQAPGAEERGMSEPTCGTCRFWAKRTAFEGREGECQWKPPPHLRAATFRQSRVVFSIESCSFHWPQPLGVVERTNPVGAS